MVAAAVELFAGSNNLQYSILHSSIHLLSTSIGFFLQPLVILPLYFSNPYLTVNCATAAQPNECERTNKRRCRMHNSETPTRKRAKQLDNNALVIIIYFAAGISTLKAGRTFLFSRQSSLALLSSLLHSLPAMMMLTLNRSLLYVAKSPVVANSSTTSSLVPVSH